MLLLLSVMFLPVIVTDTVINGAFIAAIKDASVVVLTDAAFFYVVTFLMLLLLLLM